MKSKFSPELDLLTAKSLEGTQVGHLCLVLICQKQLNIMVLKNYHREETYFNGELVQCVNM